MHGERDRKAAEEAGQVYTLPPEEEERWRNAVRPLWDEWAADMEAKGLPGREVLNETLRLIEEYAD